MEFRLRILTVIETLKYKCTEIYYKNKYRSLRTFIKTMITNMKKKQLR